MKTERSGCLALPEYQCRTGQTRFDDGRFGMEAWSYQKDSIQLDGARKHSAEQARGHVQNV